MMRFIAILAVAVMMLLFVATESYAQCGVSRGCGVSSGGGCGVQQQAPRQVQFQGPPVVPKPEPIIENSLATAMAVQATVSAPSLHLDPQQAARRQVYRDFKPQSKFVDKRTALASLRTH